MSNCDIDLKKEDNLLPAGTEPATFRLGTRCSYYGGSVLSSTSSGIYVHANLEVLVSASRSHDGECVTLFSLPAGIA